MHLLNTAALLCGVHGHEIEPIEFPEQPFMESQGDALLAREFDIPYSYESEHFVIRWGDDAFLIPGFEAMMAADFETSWEHQVDVRGWERPPGTFTHKLDVFIGNSDENTPDIDFDGGYVTLTALGIPYTVIAPAIANNYQDSPDSPLSLMAHEFNHTLQQGEGLFRQPRGRFWAEASANWAAADTTGSYTEIRSWGSFLLHPKFALYSFQSVFDQTETERTQRQYAAAMFVRFLSDRHGADLIRRSWDETDVSTQPITWLDGQLENGIRKEYADFAVSHAVGDHPYAALYSAGAAQAAPFYGQTSVTAHIEEDGSIDIGPQAWPEAYGWNNLTYNARTDSTIDIDFDALAGSQGSVPTFINTAVVESQGAFTYHPFDDTLSVELEAGDFVHIVLTSVPQSHRDRETFPYDLAVEITPIDTKSCGCQAAPVPAWGLLFLPFLARRRGER